MDSKEFITIRKRLDKTQRAIANLLGISLKAVCSYEQGWRTIPTHVARQLIFLLARKCQQRQGVLMCWDLRNCPEEKKSKCPAWEFDAGQFCWFISGTLCESVVCKSWEEKMAMCKSCMVMKNIC
jgi:DNA-binding XRE family transcriptional regulator